MISPEGHVQCNRCRNVIETEQAVTPDALTFCSVECRVEYQISNGFMRVDGALTATTKPKVIERPEIERKRREDTGSMPREYVQGSGWMTAVWMGVTALVVWKLATVYLQWEGGAGVTINGRTVIKPRGK